MNLREIRFLLVVAILCNLAKAASIRRRGEYGFFFFLVSMYGELVISRVRMLNPVLKLRLPNFLDALSHR